MIQIKLTEKERQELKQLHKTFRKDQRKSDQIKAILLLDDGYKTIEVSKILLLDEDTITLIKKKYKNRINIKSWLETALLSYEGELTKEQELGVRKFVKTMLITNSQSVLSFIEDHYGITYSKSGVIELLHRLGFVYKKTKVLPGGFDPVKQKEFKEEYKVLENNLLENEAIVFLDGCHPTHNTKVTRAWVQKGEEKNIKSNSGRTRINLHGAYNPHNQDLIIRDDPTINYASTIELFNQIEKAYPEKKTIFAFADNATYYKHKEVKEYLKTSRIFLIHLPSYSPNLNLIERLWHFMYKEIIGTNYFKSFIDFKNWILDSLNNINLYKKELKQFIGTEMHLIQAV